MSFRSVPPVIPMRTPCHSEAERGISPFVERKGVRGMLACYFLTRVPLHFVKGDERSPNSLAFPEAA